MMNWLPQILTWGSYFLILFIFLGKDNLRERYPKYLSFIGLGVLIGRIIEALLLSLYQHSIWQSQPFGQAFLRFGYFIPYVFQHFWLDLCLSLLVSCLFFLFLKSLGSQKKRFLDIGEAELGGVLGFIAGWPNTLIFISLSFLLVLISSVLKAIRQKNSLTTLSLPFILSASIVIVASLYLGA